MRITIASSQCESHTPEARWLLRIQSCPYDKRMIPQPRSLSLFVLFVLLVVVGCSESDPITQYQVPKEKPSAVVPVAESARQIAWFFKITGPPARLDDLEVPTRKLLETITFDKEGRPHWEKPEGWTDGPPQDIRFATLIPPGEPAVALSVTSLPVSTDDIGAYLLSNVNRWRGQLSLPPYAGEKWFEEAAQADELHIVRSKVGPVYLVHLTGKTEQFGETRLLAAMTLFGDPPAPPAARANSKPEENHIKSKAPEYWISAQPAQFQIAAWTCEQDQQKISVSLAHARGGLVDNLNRWRQQIGLEELEGEQLQKVAVPEKIAGRDAITAEFVGEKETILGVIVLDGDQLLFVKLKGDNDLAKREHEHWQEFLKSLEF